MRKLLIVLGLVSFLAIGCGGSDGGGSSSADDSIAQADAICKDAQAKQQEIIDGSDSSSNDPKVTTKYLEASLAQTKKTDAQLKNLTPPADYESEWKAWIAGVNEQARATQKLIKSVSSAKNGGAGSSYANELNKAITHQLKTNKLAEAAGLKVCSQNTLV